MTGGRQPTLKLPDDSTRIRLRPVALTTGCDAAVLVESGEALPLAGGPIAFLACAVSVAQGGRVTEMVLPVPALRGWADGLKEPYPGRVSGLLARLTAAREMPEGIPADRPVIMGIVNVTPDSFSDGGEHAAMADAVARGLRLAEEGADIIDIGGESVRPGADPVPPEVEAGRVVPVVEGLTTALGGKGGTRPVLSIDTRHASVMEAALAAGAGMINDVTGLTGDPRSLEVAAGTSVPVVLMHMTGEPKTMNEDPRYEHVALEVFDHLEQRVEACVAAGIDRNRLIVDPGIGFAKRKAHNREILRSLSLFHGLGCPVLAGVSRKGLTEADEARAPRDRVPGSLAAAWQALAQGVRILRVHDVAETRQVVELWQALSGAA